MARRSLTLTIAADMIAAGTITAPTTAHAAPTPAAKPTSEGPHSPLNRKKHH
ncbi:hypothetical protein [Dermatophilus congolensis]|uniref:hypothetical protein n=1 Tax=Dermatophilus congolensis TaxID=1863 RepID=UPI001AAFE32E|nr:hypothetical protein [Dermatophilus congolensis]MBO3129718.1 hypothetical protein [Dermatophilus congolensis]MBO3131652.1 hypothetical protein [Dermatophilus congolensis]MBO3134192.1 hypothetical protein [Dermatophilus congolensis]MBO3138674.1 hypothetical protein [Dermatophilus congolensis]MBO3140905.1 hypothetical protein [Dermatophilus congolensis]